MPLDEDPFGVGDAMMYYNQGMPAAVGTESIPRSALYGDTAYTGGPEDYYSNEGRNYPTLESTQGPGGSPINASTMTSLGRFLSGLKGFGGKALDFAQTPQGIMTLLSAIMTMRDRAPKTGGGVGTSYAGYKPLQRTIVQGKYGPIARYAAQGGIMHAYAQGGAVRPFPMQDGGFVLTKRAVDGAGGPEGMRQHVPEAVPIRGPGHGTSDSIPAYIQGPHGRTPAKVSNGEMYVPPGRDTRGLYALMRAMERKA